jgi:hypothetical protein
VLLLATDTWRAVASIPLPFPPIAAGLLPPGGTLAVFADTLQPALQLQLFAAPQEGLPQLAQVCNLEQRLEQCQHWHMASCLPDMYSADLVW